MTCMKKDCNQKSKNMAKTPTKKVNETRSSRNKARSRSQKLKWTKEINTRR